MMSDNYFNDVEKRVIASSHCQRTVTSAYDPDGECDVNGVLRSAGKCDHSRSNQGSVKGPIRHFVDVRPPDILLTQLKVIWRALPASKCRGASTD